MSANENGGPAFPTDPNTQPGFSAHHGMSLRDYFATHASEADLAPYLWVRSREGARYAYADAMLEARKA